MADARTLADAIIRRLEMPVIPPSYSSPDGLPANKQALEEADDALIEAMALGSGRISVGDLIRELVDIHEEAIASERVLDCGHHEINEGVLGHCRACDMEHAGTGGGA